jgi:putative ABC transport system ATP-binding protein
MALLEARGVTRRPLFAGRDLDLDRGEIVALSGPSGSGKTLFLRALADLDAVDGGEVRLDGAPRESMAAATWRSRVLYVHQAGVRLTGTVADNLARVAELRLQRERAARIRAGVDGLDAAADADRLSGGEAQALALDRALACEPTVLLLDEATSAMDPATAARWEGRVRAFADRGGAVLWVAHDTALAGRVGARQESFP